jgi:microcystin degradation protein MlrC
MRIAVGGFQHETNTFATQPATLAAFLTADAWPGLTRGPALLDAVQGINLPAAGFIEAARAHGDSIAPLLWCSATPSAPVTRDAYETISAMLLEDLAALGNVDAVYLDLHGAMVAEHIDDADGEILRRVRRVIGNDVPLIASLDFHANVSPLMVKQASVLVAFRTYPHTDMAETGARAFEQLARGVADHPKSVLRQLPFLIPLTSQCTLIDPLAQLTQEVIRREHGSIQSLHFTPGFPAADVGECGPAIFGYGTDAVKLHSASDELAQLITQCEKDFALHVLSVEEALRELDQSRHIPGRPIILADTQDNPGGGGSADTTSLLNALISHRMQRVLAGLLCDPAACTRAHAAGVGTQIDLALGAHSASTNDTPIIGHFTVVALGDGKFTATGPYYRGSRMELGPMALLRIDDIYIAVASRKQQAADQAIFRHLQVDPCDFAVLVLKSSVHFRADFGAMAQRVLIVTAPGVNIADPAQLPFKKRVPRSRGDEVTGPDR